MVVPTGLAPLDVLRPFIKRRRLGFLDQAAGGFGLVVRDHDPGVGQVDPDPVSVVAEDLDPHPVGPQHRSHEVGLDTLALEDDGPAFDAHGYQLREGSTSAGWTAAWLPAAAIIAALSVHSSSGGIVSRARPSTSSAARVRSSELAATPPATTTSVRCGASRIARSSFSRSDSTTDCSNAAARSARSWSVTLSPRSRSRYSSAVFRPLKLYSRPGSEGRGRGWRLGLPVRAMRPSAGPPGKARAASDREQVDVRRLDLRLLQGKVEQAGQPFEMVARGKLGDHAAELPMQVDLGVDHVGQHFAPAFNDRDGGFVA